MKKNHQDTFENNRRGSKTETYFPIVQENSPPRAMSSHIKAQAYEKMVQGSYMIKMQR